MEKNWLLNPESSSQSEGYSSKWLIWLVVREPLLLMMAEEHNTTQLCSVTIEPPLLLVNLPFVDTVCFIYHYLPGKWLL